MSREQLRFSFDGREDASDGRFTQSEKPQKESATPAGSVEPTADPSLAPPEAGHPTTAVGNPEQENASPEESTNPTSDASRTPLDPSHSVTESKTPEEESATPAGSVESTAGPFLASPEASDAVERSAKPETEAASLDETAKLASLDPAFAPPGAKQATASTEPSGLQQPGPKRNAKLRGSRRRNVSREASDPATVVEHPEQENASPEESTKPTSDASLAPSIPSGPAPVSESPGVESAPSGESAELTADPSLASPDASDPATDFGELENELTALEADASAQAKQLNVAGQAHERAWSELIPTLDKIQSNLSKRGKNRDRHRAEKLPSWTEWWQKFQKENDFDACLRRVQKKLKDFRERTKAREEESAKSPFIEMYDDLRVRLAKAKKAGKNPKDALIPFFLGNFSRKELHGIADELKSAKVSAGSQRADTEDLPRSTHKIS